MTKKVLGATIVQIQADVNRLRRDMRRANSTFRRQTRVLERSAQSASRRISGLFAGITFTGATAGLIRVTDDIKRFEGQLRLVSGSQQEFESTFSNVARIAQDTRSQLGATVEFYARLARSTEELNLSQSQLGAITTVTNKAIQISGATTQEAAAGAIQLSQGLASGALRGDELRSVLENLPRLGRAIADGLGVSVGQLRELGKEGALTSEAIAAALLSQRGRIEDEFSQLPVTVGQAFQRLKNNITLAFRDVDTSPVVDEINELTRLLNDPAIVQGIATISAAITKLIGLVTAGAAALGNFAKRVGETFARRINGPVKDVEGLTNEIQRLQQILMQAESVPITSPIQEEGIKNLKSQIASLKEELVSVRKEFNDFGNEGAGSVNVNVTGADLKVPDLTGVGSKKSKGKTEAERRAEANRKLLADLQTELSLTQALTNEQRVQVELTQGRLKDLDPGQKALAKRLILERQAIELRREEDEERKSRLDQQRAEEASVLLGLQRQVALTGDATEAERVRFELVEGAYKSYSAATKKRIEEYAREIDAQNAAREAAEKLAQEQEEAARKLRDTAQRFGNTFSSAFEDAIVKGNDFKSVLQGLEQDLLRLLTRILITEPLQQGISDLFSGAASGGGSGGGFSGLLGSFFGGARAAGGDVSPGRAFLVGEEGREMFVPPSRGSILSNAETERAMGAVNNVNINISTPDADSFIQSAAQSAAKAAMIAQRATARNT